MEQILENFEMYISKSTIQDGLMKWSAVNSDTSKDLYGESMSLELYRKMLSYIKNSVPPPADFKDMVCSDYWCGGMPYLSLAHYSDLNGKAVPGQPLELFIDGEQLKAKGILFDTRLGRAVWKNLKLDEMKQKSGVDDDRIRISIAFLDLAHKHGENGKVFERKSRNSVCPECKNGVGEKIYLDGYLVHLALTRVPVNPRTIMEPEDAMAKKSQIKSRKEDAVSIVGDEELVEEITKSALEEKSDAMVEMSDTESPVVEEAKPSKDSSMEDEESPDDEEEDMKEKKGGKKECSLTEGDIEVIRSLILEVLPKPVEPAPVVETPAVEKSTPITEPVQEKSGLDLATDELYNSINEAIHMQGLTVEQRLEAINPSLQKLGVEITALVKNSMGVSAPAPASNDQSLVLEALTSLTNTVSDLAKEVAVIKAQAPSVPATQSRIPAPRSIQAVVNQSQVPAKNVNPNSVANISRRSVSSQLPLVDR